MAPQAFWCATLAICRRRATRDVENCDGASPEIDPEDDSIATHAPAKGILARELDHIARKRIGLHDAKSCEDALSVSAGEAIQIFSRAVADDDRPGHGGRSSL